MVIAIVVIVMVLAVILIVHNYTLLKIPTAVHFCGNHLRKGPHSQLSKEVASVLTRSLKRITQCSHDDGLDFLFLVRILFPNMKHPEPERRVCPQ